MRDVPPSEAGQPSTDRPRGARRWPYALTVFMATAGLVAVGGPAGAVSTPATALTNSFAQTNLIANKASFGAKLVDKHLTNAWGLAAGPTTPVWVSDNNSGFASVYGGGVNGSKVTLDLTVPVPGGNPTGQVFNSDRAPSTSAGGRRGGLHRGHGLDRVQAVAGPDRGLERRGQVRGRGQPQGRRRAARRPREAVFKGLAEATTPRRARSCSPRTWPTPGSTSSTATSRW